MIRSSQGRLVFQPLAVTFGVTILGGSLQQNYAAESRSYEPDHSLTPLILAPSLSVSDPDMPENSGDKTGKMTNVSWQVDASSTSGEWTVGKDYEVDELNRLIIYGNLASGTSGKIKLTANYYDNVRAQVTTHEWECTLTCQDIVSRKFALRCPESGLNRIDVFKELTSYLLNAQFSNNGVDVPDSETVYKWQVLVDSDFVDIDTSRDMWYISGKDSKTLKVDPRCIGDICVRCSAKHTSYLSEVYNITCRLLRYYGQYEDSWLWLAGELKFTDTLYAKGRVVINRKKEGSVANPEKFFDIEVFYDNDNGMGWQHIAHGAEGRVDRNLFPVDAAHRDRFGWAVREKTELQAATVDGSVVSIDGIPAVLDVPKTARDI